MLRYLMILSASIGLAADRPQSGQPEFLLKEGTALRLRLVATVTSKTASVDDPVELMLDEDVSVGNVVVARTGSVGLGVVSHVKRSEMLGQGGELQVKLRYLRVGDVKVPIRGSRDRDGDSKETAAIALTVVFGPLGLVKRGAEAEFRRGTQFIGYVAGDVAVSKAP